MIFFTKRVALRVTEEIDKKAEELVKEFPNLYKNKQEVIRSAIVYLHRARMKLKNTNNVRRKNEKLR